jgi:hypothetical protein
MLLLRTTHYAFMALWHCRFLAQQVSPCGFANRFPERVHAGWLFHPAPLSSCSWNAKALVDASRRGVKVQVTILAQSVGYLKPGQVQPFRVHSIPAHDFTR